MAVRVVDPLQSVDVEVRDRERRRVPLGARDLLLEAVVEVAVVVDAGEGIGVRRALQALVQLGDVDGRRDLRRHGLEQREVALPVHPDGGMRHDERPDSPSRREQRHDHLGTDARVAEVARIAPHVVDDLRLAVFDHPARQATPARYARRPGEIGARPGGGADDEVSGRVLAQEDRERGAGHVPLEDREDPREQLMHVEEGVELRRDLGEDRELAGGPDLHLRGRDGAAGLDPRDELVHDGRVVPGTGEAPELRERRLRGEGAPVRAVREHRLVVHRDRQDPGEERDDLAFQSVGVTRPVPSLVRVPHDRHDRVEEFDRLEEPRAEERMLLHDLPLLRRERSTLREDRRRDADLPERVEQRCVPQVAERGVVEAEALAQADRVGGYPPLVILVIPVARLDHRRELRDRRQVGVVELQVQAHRADGRRTHAREHADELALVVGEPVRLVPRHHEHPDRLGRRAQRLDVQRAVPPLAHSRSRRFGDLLRVGDLERLPRFHGGEDGRRAL